MKKFVKFFHTISFVLLLSTGEANSQDILDKRVSFTVHEQRLDDVLTIIANQAGFSFSYNSNILKRDSLISISVNNRTVRQVLNQLFDGGYEYKASGNYVIIRRVILHLTTVTKSEPAKEKSYTISGFVVNSETGEKLSDVSIYEANQLLSTLTDANGYFSIRLKDKYQATSLAVSKASFEDTTVNIRQKYDLQLVIAIVPVQDEVIVSAPNQYETADTTGSSLADADSVEWKFGRPNELEETSFGRFLISARQKISSLNIKNFFTEKPFQVSVIPGVSTQGNMSGQVVNHFSINVLGGYTGGVKGMELAGLFNLNRKDVKYVQVAGLFNITGGSLTGLQVSGIQNTVLKSTTGFQTTGVSNFVKGDFNGVQIAGVSNINGNHMNGLQAAGVFNYQNRRSKGVQIAGVGNIAGGEKTGLQLGGVFNYAKRLKGVQIGLINISDSSEGYSIGLINVVMKGYHKLAFYTTESIDANVAFKTGNPRFYSILLGGMNVGDKDQKLYSFGYGLGTEWTWANWLSLNPELTSQYLYLGSWDHLNLLNKLYLQLNIRPAKRFTIFGGPSFAAYYFDQSVPVPGYKYDVISPSYHSFGMGSSKLRGWFGWNAGIAIF